MVEKLKIRLPVGENLVEIAGTIVEGVWATCTDKDLYKLINTPFFCHGFSQGDEIYAKDINDVVSTDDIITQSANSTVFVASRNTEHFEKILAVAQKYGCSFERSDINRCTAISVGESLNLETVYQNMVGLEPVQKSWVLITSQRHHG